MKASTLVVIGFLAGTWAVIGCGNGESNGSGGAGGTAPGWFWQNPLPTGNSLYDVWMTDANTGTAVGAFGIIVRTTDGGTTWTAQDSGNFKKKKIVWFTDATTGTAVGDGGTIVRTTDGGTTWTTHE